MFYGGGGNHLLAIYNTVLIHADLDPYFLVGINASFTLMICALFSTHFALLFWRNSILEYESSLVVH